MIPQAYAILREDRTQGEKYDSFFHVVTSTMNTLAVMSEELSEATMEVESEKTEENPTLFYSNEQFEDHLKEFMDFLLDVSTRILMEGTNGKNCMWAFSLLRALFVTPRLARCRPRIAVSQVVMSITEREDQYELWYSQVVPALVRAVLAYSEMSRYSELNPLWKCIPTVFCIENMNSFVSDTCRLAVAKTCMEWVRDQGLSGRNYLAKDNLDEMQTLVVNNLLSVLTNQGEMDSLYLQNIETLLDPYKVEEKEELSFELPETILDVESFMNTGKHIVSLLSYVGSLESDR